MRALPGSKLRSSLGLATAVLISSLPACSSPFCYSVPFGEKGSLILGTPATIADGSTARVVLPAVYETTGADVVACPLYTFDYSGTTVEATGHGALTYESSGIVPSDDQSWLRGGLALYIHCDLSGAEAQRDALDVRVLKDGVEKYRDTFQLDCARVLSFTLTTPAEPIHVGATVAVLPHVKLADSTESFNGTFLPVDASVLSIDDPSATYAFYVTALAPAQKPLLRFGSATAALPFDIIP